MNRLQRLEEVCRKLQREYEKEREGQGFPFNFDLRDLHEELGVLLDAPEREEKDLYTGVSRFGWELRWVKEDIKPGDKVCWAGEIDPEFLQSKEIVLLPPWIDEPHPLGEIQRVFQELHEEGH